MALFLSDVDRFEATRPRLEAIAYRMLGSASEAEDAVQETYLRWQATDVGRIEVPEAWLTKVLTNLCLNQLTSARARRETYVGQWLPEPLLEGDPMLGPAETAEQRESVSYAVMVLLERLTPNERAVYVLREAFAYSHREIAEILDLSEAASQQIFHRAKKHVAQGKPLLASGSDGASAARSGEAVLGGVSDGARSEIDEAAVRRIVEEFLAAATSGRTEPLIKLLTSDAIAVGDGGGKVPARASAFEGARAVAKFLRGLFKLPGQTGSVGRITRPLRHYGQRRPRGRGGRRRAGLRHHVPGAHAGGHCRDPQSGQPRQAGARHTAVGGGRFRSASSRRSPLNRRVTQTTRCSCQESAACPVQGA